MKKLDKLYVGKRLDNLLKELKISQKEMGKSIGVCSNVINEISLGLYEEENIYDILKNIIKFYNLDKKYFNKPSIPRKKNIAKTISRESDNNDSNGIYEPSINNRIFTLEEIKQLPIEKTIIYKNKGLTYELKNNDKTVICSYCGQTVEKQITKINDIFSVCEYKCSCKDFLKNSYFLNEDESLAIQVLDARLKNGYKAFLAKTNLNEDSFDENTYDKAIIFLKVNMIYKDKLTFKNLI